MVTYECCAIALANVLNWFLYRILLRMIVAIASYSRPRLNVLSLRYAVMHGSYCIIFKTKTECPFPRIFYAGYYLRPDNSPTIHSSVS